MTGLNHFLIDPPAMISFSGGRTSGYMLYRIIAAHEGMLPDDVHVVFANTGKEREETLRFVQQCSVRWQVDIRWVEWRKNPSGFAEVDFHDASRKGEPFAELIADKQTVPRGHMRFCTNHLKVKTMAAFMQAQGLIEGSYTEAVGLRYDEGHRILKMLERNDQFSRRCRAPLSRARQTIHDVMAFWAAQPFDLELRPGEGNCDLCFLKGVALRKELIRRRPESVQWWIEQERKTGFNFSGRESFTDLLNEVTLQPDMFDELVDEHDTECGLLCSADEPSTYA